MLRDVRRVDAPAPVDVGGEAARFVDQQRGLADSLPLALTLLTLTTFTILFLMTGSVVLPLKALLMNLLTLSATFGLLVLIFQDGRLEGVLDFQSAGGLEATQPVLLFAIAFGLATDYAVFLLSRIKEARDGGLPDREAVAFGVERTGRIVTAAALLFIVAVGAFATSGVLFIKQVGIGTAIAVAIDATRSCARCSYRRSWRCWAAGTGGRRRRCAGCTSASASAKGRTGVTDASPGSAFDRATAVSPRATAPGRRPAIRAGRPPAGPTAATWRRSSCARSSRRSPTRRASRAR